MPQLLLPGMPEGAIRINSVVSRFAKDGQVTWFLGADNYFSHPADDTAGHRLALATLMVNGHACSHQIQKTLGTAPRSLVRWRKQLTSQGAPSFYQPRGVRGGAVLTAETSAKCRHLLDESHSIATTARLAGIKDSTLRKAIAAGRIAKPGTADQAVAPADANSSTKSQRSRTDADVISKAVTEGLATTLLDEILPELLDGVPGQPTPAQLQADPLLHRFVVIIDREGSHHSLLSKLWQQRVGVITYRKNVTDTCHFTEAEDCAGEDGKFSLAFRATFNRSHSPTKLKVTCRVAKVMTDEIECSIDDPDQAQLPL